MIHLLAATLGGLLLIRLLVLAQRRFVFRSRDHRAILYSHIGALVFGTGLGGFGLADGGPPRFGEAFGMYVLPIVLSALWDFWRLRKRAQPA